MRDAVGILAALGVVRLFWDGVVKWSEFYQRHWHRREEDQKDIASADVRKV